MNAALSNHKLRSRHSRQGDRGWDDSFLGTPVMIHFSCDRCKRMIDPEDELRYTVKLEICAAMDTVDACDCEDDRDHLLEVQEILERLEADEDDHIGEDIYQKKHFDLCPRCYREFIKNPLGREQPVHLGFSAN